MSEAPWTHRVPFGLLIFLMCILINIFPSCNLPHLILFSQTYHQDPCWVLFPLTHTACCFSPPLGCLLKQASSTNLSSTASHELSLDCCLMINYTSMQLEVWLGYWTVHQAQSPPQCVGALVLMLSCHWQQNVSLLRRFLMTLQKLKKSLIALFPFPEMSPSYSLTKAYSLKHRFLCHYSLSCSNRLHHPKSPKSILSWLRLKSWAARVQKRGLWYSDDAWTYRDISRTQNLETE